MKAICIAVSNRPDIVRQTLAALRANQTEGWTLYMSCEPDAPEVHALVRAINWMESRWWINGTRLGPELNTFTVCFKAMNDGADALLYFDDDMLLSPDALNLCNWYLENHTEKYPGGLCLCTDASDPARPNSISPNDTWRGLVGQGYCYTCRQWQDFVKPNFWQDNPAWGGHGYDWALGYRSVELGKTILRPRLSRSQHIGVHGHHPPGRIFPDHISNGENRNYAIEER